MDLSRKELQQLAKANGISANLKSCILVEQLQLKGVLPIPEDIEAEFEEASTAARVESEPTQTIVEQDAPEGLCEMAEGLAAYLETLHIEYISDSDADDVAAGVETPAALKELDPALQKWVTHSSLLSCDDTGRLVCLRTGHIIEPTMEAALRHVMELEGRDPTSGFTKDSEMFDEEYDQELEALVEASPHLFFDENGYVFCGRTGLVIEASVSAVLEHIMELERTVPVSGDRFKLRGVPSPKGRKIRFVSDDNENTVPVLVPRNENSNARPCTPKSTDPFKLNGVLSPKGRKTVFESPDMSTASAVHWRMEDYESCPLKSCDAADPNLASDSAEPIALI